MPEEELVDEDAELEDDPDEEELNAEPPVPLDDEEELEADDEEEVHEQSPSSEPAALHACTPSAPPGQAHATCAPGVQFMGLVFKAEDEDEPVDEVEQPRPKARAGSIQAMRIERGERLSTARNGRRTDPSAKPELSREEASPVGSGRG